MLINDLQNDLKYLIKEENTTQKALGDKVGIAQTNVIRVAKRPINKGYIALMEALGYDIKITYIPRKKELNEIL